MRDLVAELKELRLHGMVSAWAELQAQDDSALAASRWLVHLSNRGLTEPEHPLIWNVSDKLKWNADWADYGAVHFAVLPTEPQFYFSDFCSEGKAFEESPLA
jgi:hypothetical protein